MALTEKKLFSFSNTTTLTKEDQELLKAKEALEVDRQLQSQPPLERLEAFEALDKKILDQ
jgi:hypothetical protein